MKKLFALIAAIALIVISTVAQDIRTAEKLLPQSAQTILKNHFPNKFVNNLEENNLFTKKYKVTLNDGTEIEFNKDGQWTEIDCGHNAVPSALLLPAITKYVDKNFNGNKIVKVEMKRNTYEVELSSDIELIFNKAGKFLKIDN